MQKLQEDHCSFEEGSLARQRYGSSFETNSQGTGVKRAPRGTNSILNNTVPVGHLPYQPDFVVVTAEPSYLRKASIFSFRSAIRAARSSIWANR